MTQQKDLLDYADIMIIFIHVFNILTAISSFQLTDTVRIVLEEDGTELETDESLYVYADKILMALPGGESWRKDKDQNNQDMDTSKFTFDVCSFDRKSRKLVLAEGLEDLKQQGSICFGYPVAVVCLESDGTVVDEDVKLLAYANQVFMLLSLTQIWAPNYSAYITDKDSLCGTDKKMFKIKTLEGKDKIAIVANNVVELHLLAARILKLNPPIQIHTEEGTTVVSDSDLIANQGRLLIVTELKRSNTSRVQSRQDIEQSPRQHANFNQTEIFPYRQSINLHRNSLSNEKLSEMHPRSSENYHRYYYGESVM